MKNLELYVGGSVALFFIIVGLVLGVVLMLTNEEGELAHSAGVGLTRAFGILLCVVFVVTIPCGLVFLFGKKEESKQLT